MSKNLYRERLLDHFHNPRNRGELEAMPIVKRGSNPRCGDEIEIGLRPADGVVDELRFRGRGCSICLASASIMTETASGREFDEARRLASDVEQWFDRNADEPTPDEELAALVPVRQHRARRKCVMLAWEALTEALDEADQAS